MSASAKILDFNQPETARAVGGELAATGEALVIQLRESAVIDLATLEQAVRDRQTLGQAIARVAQFFAPFKAMAHQLHKALCDREREILAPLEQLDQLKRTAIAAYKRDQDRIRQEQERTLAEQRRRDEQDRAAAEAAQLEIAGEHEMAAAVVADAIAAPAPVVVLPDATKAVEGLKFTRRWLWRFAGGPADLKQTPPTVLARTMQLIPREYLCVDEKKVGAIVRSSKGTIRIPGIDVYYVDDPVR